MFNEEDDELQPGMTSINPVDNSAPLSAPPPPIDPAVKNAVMQKFNLGPYSDEARQKLIDQNKGPDFGGALQQGLAGVAAAFQGRDSAAAANAVADRLKGQKKDELAQFEQGRANKIQGYKLAQEMKEDQRKNDLSDSTSQASENFRNLMQDKFPELAKSYGDKWQNVTAADESILFKPLQLKEQIDARKEAAKMAADARREARQDSLARRDEDKYQTYVTNAEHQASSLRGDDAAKASSAKLSAIASGRALLDQFKGREDQMTNDQLALLAADRVKAVTGGVPTNDEIKHMMPSNRGTAWAATKGFFTNSPEPANSGDWVKEAYTDFAAQEAAARKILENRQKQVSSNPRLRPEDRARLEKMAVPPEFYEPNQMSAKSDDSKKTEQQLAMEELERREKLKSTVSK